jgi:hypothetical protein
MHAIAQVDINGAAAGKHRERSGRGAAEGMAGGVVPAPVGLNFDNTPGGDWSAYMRNELTTQKGAGGI